MRWQPRRAARHRAAGAVRRCCHSGDAWLDDEDIGAAHVLLDLQVDLTIAEVLDRDVTERHVEVLTDPAREIHVPSPGENAQSSAHRHVGRPFR
jgi:hypothetical protein